MTKKKLSGFPSEFFQDLESKSKKLKERNRYLEKATFTWKNHLEIPSLGTWKTWEQRNRYLEKVRFPRLGTWNLENFGLGKYWRKEIETWKNLTFSKTWDLDFQEERNRSLVVKIRDFVKLHMEVKI